MRKSEAVRIAEIAREREMWHDVIKVLTDPLWSSVLGFIVIHEARRANLVGPVADDILYAGVITINGARAGVEIAEKAAPLYTGIQGQITGQLTKALELVPMLGAVK